MEAKVKPFHLFQHQGFWCAVNIEEMQPFVVDENTAGILGKLNDDTSSSLQPGTADQLEILGLLAVEETQIRKKVRKKSVPIVNMALFLTQSCNLNCIYCYGEGGGYGSGGSLNERTAYQAIDWLVAQSGEMKKIHVGFFGGEPFLKFPMMKAVTAYAQKKARHAGKKAAFSVTTNATLLDEEKIAFIKEHDINVLVSFDGPREIHDSQRPFADGRGSYDHIIPNLKKLLAACPGTGAHAVIIGQTDPERVKKELRSTGFTKVSVLPASFSLLAEKSRERESARGGDGLLTLMEQEADTWLELIGNKDSQTLKTFMASSQLYHGLVSFLHNVKKPYPCEAGLRMVAVSCAGDVYLCHRFVGRDEYKLGNVFENDLDREKYQRSPLTFVEQCGRCSAKHICAGGCKYDHAASCGSVFKPSDDMCRIRRREAELAAYIVCRLTDEDRYFLSAEKIVPPKPCLFDF